jgi:hypothetical protein
LRDRRRGFTRGRFESDSGAKSIQIGRPGPRSLARTQIPNPPLPMVTFSSLNYFHILVTAIAGFLLGWIWYSALFGSSWRKEMNLTAETLDAAKPMMASMMIKGFVYTFISTVGLAAALTWSPHRTAVGGLKLGATIGLLVVGARFANTAIWERKSAKLQAINIAHEVALFALQGVILAAWV